MDKNCLIISDLDGTLAIRSAELTSFTHATLSSLIKEGMPFTFATGRGLGATMPEATSLGIKLPMVLYNGALIYHPLHYRTEKIFGISDCLAEEITRILDHYGLHARICTYQRDLDQIVAYSDHLPWYSSRPVVKKPDQTPCEVVHTVKNPHAEYKTNGNEVVFMSHLEQYDLLKDAVEQLRKLPGLQIIFHPTHANNGRWYLDILSTQAGKGNGTRFIREQYSLPRCVAFGDGDNDVEMMQQAEKAYVPPHATPAAKAAATGILQTDDPDMVAKYILENYSTF